MDAVTDAGLDAAGLPASYPADVRGARIAHAVTQPIGQAAWDVGLPGVACRSAVAGASSGDEELAWFDRGGTLRETQCWIFDVWFWTDER